MARIRQKTEVELGKSETLAGKVGGRKTRRANLKVQNAFNQRITPRLSGNAKKALGTGLIAALVAPGVTGLVTEILKSKKREQSGRGRITKRKNKRSR